MSDWHALARSAADEEGPQARTLEEALDQRIFGLAEWLEQHSKVVAEQRHLDEGSRERAYWHYGYLAALRDFRELLLQRANLN